MMGERPEPIGRRSLGSASIEGVYAELSTMLVEAPDVDDFLGRLAELAASVVPGTRCVISLRSDRVVDPAVQVDQTMGVERVPGQRLPPLQDVDSSAADSDGSGMTIPLVVNGVDLGSLRSFADSPRAFSEEEVERLQSFSRYAATALMLRLHQSGHLVLDDDLQEALATRAVIDQAMGVLMHARKITSRQAFEVLRRASQTRNRKVSAIAAEVIEALTGQPPEPSRPLAPSRTTRRHEQSN